ncbi:hypothetical protein [Krasilnikovia sp. MM14-A1004]|uniref:LppU/SCO3897 family protein n=1 Tax=Krasilnikovia sp. MM14-A1004 TaxID=3373541 RepID=UPI00399CCC8B
MSNPVGPTPAPEGGNIPVSDPSAVTGMGDAPAAPKKKSKVGRIILAIVGMLILIVVAGVAKFMLRPDPTKDTKAGDCLASETAKDVKVGEEGVADMKPVDCKSKDAAFVVLGRVDGVTDINNPACEKFVKEGEQYLAYASQSGDGYLLCLKQKS